MMGSPGNCGLQETRAKRLKRKRKSWHRLQQVIVFMLTAPAIPAFMDA
jgi:hypothetical protein